jgi:hypothetical protein
MKTIILEQLPSGVIDANSKAIDSMQWLSLGDSVLCDVFWFMEGEISRAAGYGGDDSNALHMYRVPTVFADESTC